jgi:hypothetical protein
VQGLLEHFRCKKRIAGRPRKKLARMTFPMSFHAVEFPLDPQKALSPSRYPQALEFVIDGVIKKYTTAQG